MKALLVLTPGAMTTIQDLGRTGFAHMGVPLSGALDQEAAGIANALLGNPAEAAVLECTVVGPSFAVLEKVELAISGADMGTTLNNKPIPNWSTFSASAGDVLTFGQIKSGCRAYLAVCGGFEVPMVMGSLSTYLTGKIGGIDGRPLRRGDYLHRFEYRPPKKPLTLASSHLPVYSDQIELRILDGPQVKFFGRNAHLFFQSSYHVSNKADRSGYRLNGPSLRTADGFSHTIISEPIVRGSIQIPPDGQPIVLFTEQTVGGYAKIGTVITPDISRLAQAIPGDTVVFRRVDLKTAHSLYREWILRRRMLFA